MKLETPRCPNCNALLDGTRAGMGQCTYCGATIIGRLEAGAKTETRFWLVLRVGPSNRERVAAVLAERLGLGPDESRSALNAAPAEIEVGINEERAHALARDLAHAGAVVEIAERLVEVRLVRVFLDGVGEDPLGAIVAIRRHLDVGLHEARRLARRAPAVIAGSMPERPALALVAALKKAGARARIG